MKPDLQFSVLCDDVRREDNGKFMLIGLFEAIGAAQFPLSYPGMCVVNRWCNGQGKYMQKTRLMGPGNEVLVETQETPVELPDTLANVTALSLFRNIRFAQPGRHWIEVLLDNDLKQRYPLMIMKIEAPQGSNGPSAPPGPPAVP